jgi:hypothetical protein
MPLIMKSDLLDSGMQIGVFYLLVSYPRRVEL